MKQGFGDLIAETCHKHFNSLPKNGKPTAGKEWTVMAAIVQHDNKGNNIKVVSMGTGTSCLGGNQMKPDGSVIHDCHAEVIAKRNFRRYLYHQLLNAYSSKSESSIFRINSDSNGTCSLKEGILFSFYTSHSPCGDASIFPILATTESSKSDSEQLKSDEDKRAGLKRKISIPDSDDHIVPGKLIRTADNLCNDVKLSNRTSPDISRTGASPAPGQLSDLHLPGADYHRTGLFRTKPGRGEPTTSMCCSDKIVKWNIMGWQGALLSHFVPKPIYVETMVTSGLYFSENAMKRALWERLDHNHLNKILKQSSYKLHRPDLLHSAESFAFSKDVPGRNGGSRGLKRSGSAISWCFGVERKPFQALAKGGFLIGATRKSDPKKTRVEISRSSLFGLFKTVLALVPENSTLSEHLKSMNDGCYSSYKKSSKTYHQTWSNLKSCLFNSWVTHDSVYDDFTVDGNP